MSEIHTYNKDTCKVADILLIYSKKYEVSSHNLIMTFACSDDIKGCLPHNHLLHEAFELSNGAKFGLSRLVVFEVSTLHLQSDPNSFIMDEVLKAKFLNIQGLKMISIKFDRMSQSINEYMIHRVKIGAMGLIPMPTKFTNREFFQAFEGLVNQQENLQESHNLKSLPDQLTDQVLLRVKEDSFDANLSPKTPEVVKEAPKVDEPAPEVEKPKPAGPDNKASPVKQGTNQTAKAPEKPVKGGKPTQKGTPQTPVQGASKTPTQAPVPDEPAQKNPTEAAQVQQPENPEVSFRDLLLEFCFGGLPKDLFIAHPLLSTQPELTSFVRERLTSFKPRVILKYNNANKYKCLLCSKPNLHECRIQSNTGNSLEELDTLLREGRDKDETISTVVLNLGVLVEDADLKQALANRILANSYDGGSSALQNKMTLTLDYCLEHMQKKEDMGQDSLVDCAPCSKKTEREVCSVIHQVPPLLVIQLKRFMTKVDYKTGKTDKKKITMMVELPADITLKGKVFELYGLVNHYGEIDKGHYTACVRRPTDQQWFLYDDEKVKPITFKEVNTEGAYLLFYLEKPTSSS